MSSDLARGGKPSTAVPIGSVDETPVKYLHLKESSSIPSLLRGTDSFTITRLESSSGLAAPITKVSTVPALLVAVSITSLARADYQFWVDEKRVPTPSLPDSSGPMARQSRLDATSTTATERRRRR